MMVIVLVVGGMTLVKLTLECWTRHRVDHLNVLLGSLHNQTFQDWDITILEEADCDYLKNPIFVGIIRRLKNQGHKVVFLHPSTMLGCVGSAMAVMAETSSKYAMKLDDDHVFDADALEKLVTAMEDDQSIGSLGGMLYPIDREIIQMETIPDDFNKWTGPDKRIWNDYSTMTFEFPEQVVEVDFVRAPFMYRADKLRESGWLELYPTLGYTAMAHRIESEMANTLKVWNGMKTCIHTGVVMWHYLSPTGGCRMINPDTRTSDDVLYYDRWGELHGTET